MAPGRANVPRAASHDSFSSVEVLEEAPEHLRRKNNRDAPVIVDSDDEEPLPPPRSAEKRPSPPSIEASQSAKRHRRGPAPGAVRAVPQGVEILDEESVFRVGLAQQRPDRRERRVSWKDDAEVVPGAPQAAANRSQHLSASAGPSRHANNLPRQQDFASAPWPRNPQNSAAGPSHLPARPAHLSSPVINMSNPRPLPRPPAPAPPAHSPGAHPSSSSVYATPPSGSSPVRNPPLPDERPREPSPAVQVSPADQALTRILEILPDIDPAWALVQIHAHLPNSENPHYLYERVITAALEMAEGYPKAPVKGKGKEVAVEAEEGSAEGYKSLVYRRAHRIGRVYLMRALSALDVAFPIVPLPHLRSVLFGTNVLYTPTYFALVEQNEQNPKPWVELKRPRKGKNVAIEPSAHLAGTGDDEGAAEFEREKEWLDALLEKEATEKNEAEAKRIAYEEAIAQGHGIECGCCFGDELLENMVQCAEGHLFCNDCALQHAETKLGDQQTTILCMDTGGCQFPFPESELTRLLPAKSLGLYHRLKQAKELELAGIEGLESCPSCPYSAIIDNPDEKLFRCMREGCMQVTCRKCRHPEHIPKTCEEMEADRKLNSRHAVEDAMSEALIRKCPKCSKPFIKESGCNKITCTGCRTLSCYICRKVITGYDHFDQNPADYRKAKIAGNCRLWDPVNNADLDNEAIMAARDAAQARAREEAEAEGVQLADDDLNVAMPVGQAAGQGIGLPGLQGHAAHFFPLALVPARQAPALPGFPIDVGAAVGRARDLFQQFRDAGDLYWNAMGIPPPQGDIARMPPAEMAGHVERALAARVAARAPVPGVAGAGAGAAGAVPGVMPGYYPNQPRHVDRPGGLAERLQAMRERQGLQAQGGLEAAAAHPPRPPPPVAPAIHAGAAAPRAPQMARRGRPRRRGN
ncbi:hypothetical protein IAT38_005621 [Cryptococcus sp. DSM 104549]